MRRGVAVSGPSVLDASNDTSSCLLRLERKPKLFRDEQEKSRTLVRAAHDIPAIDTVRFSVTAAQPAVLRVGSRSPISRVHALSCASILSLSADAKICARRWRAADEAFDAAREHCVIARDVASARRCWKTDVRNLRAARYRQAALHLPTSPRMLAVAQLAAAWLAPAGLSQLYLRSQFCSHTNMSCLRC